jgi:hypothetical protein
MAEITPIQFLRGTAAAWTTANPTLAAGKPGFETDTGKLKIGDGTTAWTSLPYTSSSHFRGAYNASGNTYPAAGAGSGTAGAIQAGDEWYVSVSGQITARTGSMIVEVGTILKALTNVPGQTATNWAVIQVS